MEQISEYYKQKIISQGEVTDEDTADLSEENFRRDRKEEGEQEGEEGNVKKDPPKHVAAVKQVYIV